MALHDRATPDALSWLSRLERAPYAIEFHVALRRIECLFRDRARFGKAVHPRQEPVRLGQEPSLSFAPSTLESFVPPEADRPGRLLVTFFGLFGPQGPLPLHLTEYARDRLKKAGDATFASFANVFHHRLLSLFHRAWASAEPTVSQDRPSESRFASYLGSLCGLGAPALQKRDPIEDTAKLHYASLLASLTRSAAGLRALLGDFFEIPVAIEEFVGDWVELPESLRFTLGFSEETSTLGRTTVLGARAWLCQHKFRIVLGPLSREQFARLLPGSEGLERFVAMVRLYAGDELVWDMRLVLAPDALHQFQLAGATRLGWNTRLGRTASASTFEDLVVNPLLEQTHRSTSGGGSHVGNQSRNTVWQAQ
jgi:type VI secretion system protein ImpH